MRTHQLNKVILTLTVFITLFAANNALANLVSKVDRSQISMEETVTLTVRYEGNAKQSAPDFSLLKSQFDILSQRQSSQIQNFNGSITSFTDWTLTIAPKREGELLIPSFNYNGSVSDAIEIRVTPAADLPVGQIRDVFIETLIDKESAYVQEQVIVRYRLYFSRNVDSLDAEPLSIDGVNIEGLQDARYQRTVSGKAFQIVEFSYALYPQESGELVIPAQTWQVSLPISSRPRSFFGSGRYETKRLRTESKTVTVKPKPESFPKNAVWLPASELSVAESWSQDPRKFKVGEPITRTIKILSEGLIASQLPEVLENDQSSSVKVYAEAPQLENENLNEGVTSTRTENAAYVISAAGEHAVREVEIAWWDVDEDKLKFAKLPARRISITPEPGVKSSTQSPIPSAPTSPLPSEENAIKVEAHTGIWKPLAILFAGLWILTLIGSALLLKKTKINIENIDESPKRATRAHTLFKQFELACATNAPEKIKPSIIEWATAYFNKSIPISLDDIAASFLNNNELKKTLNQIDSSLYGHSTDAYIDGLALLAIIKVCKNEYEKSATKGKHDLPPLYA